MKWENVLRTKAEVVCMVLFCPWDLPQDLKEVNIGSANEGTSGLAANTGSLRETPVP